MDYVNPDSLVSTDWLAERLEDPHVRILDCTWFLPGSERDALFEFELRHIPGARFFDVESICDTSTDLPHMLPLPDDFARRVGALGISSDCHVVVYDSAGGYLAAARVWWMFKVFGHDRVSVLNGGLLRWGKERREMEDGPPDHGGAIFHADFRPYLVRSAEQVKALLADGSEQVVDARNALRFAGHDWEPRPVKHKGHMPGAHNLPVTELMVGRKDFVMRPADELIAALEKAGVDPARPVVSTCGSGITAAVIVFALHLLGRERAAVYDGSWAEWGNRDDVPVICEPCDEEKVAAS